jgi:predicted hydrocarbon binding protein
MKDQHPSSPEEHDMRVAFFIMPIYFLKVIRDEYAGVAGDEGAKEMLFRSGFKCGQTMTKKMNINHEERINLAEALIALWIEVGLGRLEIHEGEADTIVITSDDSSEAQANGRVGKTMCDLTCGFIAGIASEVTGTQHSCFEESCWSRGDELCKYLLKPE